MRHPILLLLPLFALFIGFAGFSRQSEPELAVKHKAADITQIPELTLDEMLDIPGKRSITIIKDERRLYLYAGDILLKAYPISIGEYSIGPKQIQGDRKTPEGEYYICYQNLKSDFHIFLGLSYPNEQDARRGLTQGLITEAEHNDIVNCIKRRVRPPWNTKLGGEIGIHGEGPGNTLGCISMSNANIEEIYHQVSIDGSIRVTILPQSRDKRTE